MHFQAAEEVQEVQISEHILFDYFKGVLVVSVGFLAPAEAVHIGVLALPEAETTWDGNLIFTLVRFFPCFQLFSERIRHLPRVKSIGYQTEIVH